MAHRTKHYTQAPRTPWGERPAQRLRREAGGIAPALVLAFLVGAAAVGWVRFGPILDFAGLQQTSPTSTPRSIATAFGMCRSKLDRDCVVDGDTIRIGAEVMRIEGMDAPETFRDVCGGRREMDLGKRAASRLQDILNRGRLTIARNGSDRYGRTLAALRVDGRDVASMMISEHLARRWPDGDEWWCRS